MPPQVLHAALEHVREAVTRNAKMFREDGDRADNVLEVRLYVCMCVCI